MVLTGMLVGEGPRGSWGFLAVDLGSSSFQVIVQSGRHPTVLQKLCQLPFQYFSDPRLIKVLFPSLIAACYNNRQNKIILEQEMSCVLLATFIQVLPVLCPMLLRSEVNQLFIFAIHINFQKIYVFLCLKINF